MTSLPIPSCPVQPVLISSASSLGPASSEDEQFLLRAFRSFSEAAGSLERSYGLLRSEVARLGLELEASNTGLACSLEENTRMRQHLDRILEGLPCGVVVVDGDGEISRVNPEGRRCLGMADAPRLSTDLSIVSLTAPSTAPESFSSLRAELRELLTQSRTTVGEHERLVSGGTGHSRWLSARHAAIPDRIANASVFILRDVSESKHLEEVQGKLRREQALAEMSAVLAHEVRNPLGSLELFAGLLAEAGLNSECQQWVEHVQAGLRTLTATVNNVLHFHSLPDPASPNLGLPDRQRPPVDLGLLLDWARDFFLPLARRARVEISLHNRLARVMFAADRHALEQVLANLVLNALHAMPGGGWIELTGGTSIRNNRSYASILVADTGPGIRTEHLTEIFEPGFSTRAGSPGLGLAVCRKILSQHRGEIEASSRAGTGASFTLTFPLQGDAFRSCPEAYPETFSKSCSASMAERKS